MYTITRWLDEDIRTGEVVRIVATATLNGETRVLVVKDDGEFWVYLDRETSNTTGEIARQVDLPSDHAFRPGAVTAIMFHDVLDQAFQIA